MREAPQLPVRDDDLRATLALGVPFDLVGHWIDGVLAAVELRLPPRPS